MVTVRILFRRNWDVGWRGEGREIYLARYFTGEEAGRIAAGR